MKNIILLISALLVSSSLSAQVVDTVRIKHITDSLLRIGKIRYKNDTAKSAPIELIGKAKFKSDSINTDSIKERFTGHFAAIKVIAKNTGSNVILRWVPTTPGAWHLLNRYGYQVERKKFKSQDEFNTAEYTPLSKEALKPLPIEAWAKICPPMTTDSVALIAAQTIHGKNQEYYGQLNWVGQADMFQSLYTFCLAACDFSPNAATASALRFVDTDIDTSYKYIYRIISNIPDTLNYPVESGIVYVEGNNIQRDKPLIIKDFLELEHNVQLKWLREEYQGYYTSYYVESSVDGKTYTRLTRRPYVSNPLEDDVNLYPFSIYNDSTANYQPHYYRIIGITPFGELSAPSEPVLAMGRDRTPPKAPEKITVKDIGGNQMQISWECQPTETDIKGIVIYRGNSVAESSAFFPITEGLPTTTRSYIHKNVNYDSLNFYIVGIQDTAGNVGVSSPIFGEMIDTVPPAPPTGLKGTIDIKGIVKVKWPLGPEKDIIGYQVLFSNAPDHNFAARTNRPLQDTVFTDTVSLNVLTEEIYYKVVAIDKKFNYSKYSSVLILKKPDIVPPRCPVITDNKINDGNIDITWAQSTSNDVVNNMLYRRTESDTTWRQVFKTGNQSGEMTYSDTTVVSNTTYEYKVQALDDDGLLSNVAYTIQVKMPDFSKKPVVKDIVAKMSDDQKSINISWKYPHQGNFYYVLYKAINGSNFTTYKKLLSSQSEFTDDRIEKGEQYEYTLKVVYGDGKESAFSPYASVKF
jgi:uncharacterized protein